MFPYLLLFIMLLVSTLLYDGKKHTKQSDAVYWMCCLALILFAGLRYRVGGDTLSYHDDYPLFPEFRAFTTTDFSLLKYEPLFYTIVAIAKLFSKEFWVFQLFQAIIVNVSVFIVINRYVKYRCFAALLYFIFFYLYFNMEIMREAVAISVFLLASNSLIKGKYFVYYICAIVAVFFHISAIFIFIFPLLYKLLSSMRYFFILLIIMSIVYVVMIANPEIILFLPLKVALKLYSYISIGASSMGTLILYFIHAFALFMLYSLGRRIDSLRPLLPFLLINVLIFTLSSFVQGFYRITNYFALFEVICIAKEWEYLRPQWLKKQLSIFGLFLSFSCLLTLKTFSLTLNTSVYAANTRFYNLYIPYESIFSPKQHKLRENIYYIQLEDGKIEHEIKRKYNTN